MTHSVPFAVASRWIRPRSPSRYRAATVHARLILLTSTLRPTDFSGCFFPSSNRPSAWFAPAAPDNPHPSGQCGRDSEQRQCGRFETSNGAGANPFSTRYRSHHSGSPVDERWAAAGSRSVAAGRRDHTSRTAVTVPLLTSFLDRLTTGRQTHPLGQAPSGEAVQPDAGPWIVVELLPRGREGSRVSQ